MQLLKVKNQQIQFDLLRFLKGVKQINPILVLMMILHLQKANDFSQQDAIAVVQVRDTGFFLDIGHFS